MTDTKELARQAGLPEVGALDFRAAQGQTMTKPEREAWERIERFVQLVREEHERELELRMAKTIALIGRFMDGPPGVGPNASEEERARQADYTRAHNCVGYAKALLAGAEVA